MIDKDLFLDTLIDIQLAIVYEKYHVYVVRLFSYNLLIEQIYYITSMILFITLCHSYEEIRTKFIEHPKLSLWLKNIITRFLRFITQTRSTIKYLSIMYGNPIITIVIVVNKLPQV